MSSVRDELYKFWWFFVETAIPTVPQLVVLPGYIARTYYLVLLPIKNPESTTGFRFFLRFDLIFSNRAWIQTDCF